MQNFRAMQFFMKDFRSFAIINKFISKSLAPEDLGSRQTPGEQPHGFRGGAPRALENVLNLAKNLTRK